MSVARRGPSSGCIERCDGPPVGSTACRNGYGRRGMASSGNRRYRVPSDHMSVEW